MVGTKGTTAAISALRNGSRAAIASRTLAESGRAVSLVDDAARIGASSVDDAARIGASSADDLARAAASARNSRGAVGALEGADDFARGVTTTAKQLQKKFQKHADDFGIEGNYNPAQGRLFGEAVEAHVGAEGTSRIVGTYPNLNTPAIHYVDRSTRLNVITKPDGTFVSGWRLSEDQFRHVTTHGDLR